MSLHYLIISIAMLKLVPTGIIGQLLLMQPIMLKKHGRFYYGDRGGLYDFEGGSEIAAPSSGYIWNEVINKKLSLEIMASF